MYNSIQNGSTCRECFPEIVQKARDEGNLVGLSERYRITGGMVLAKVRDYTEGLPPDPMLDDEYVDQAIIYVPDPRDSTTREVIIIATNLSPEDCYHNNE